MVEAPAADVGAASSKAEPVRLEDLSSVAARLAAAIIKAKVEVMQEQGVKALPLSVARCRAECHGTAGTVFHTVDFQTSYDFTKVSRLHVDAENTQEVIDPTATVQDGVQEQLVLRGVPVVLQAGHSAKVKLVFAYVYTEPGPLLHWVLVNSRGEQATLISTAIQGDTGARQQQCSMFVFPGGPAEVYAQWAAAEACLGAATTGDGDGAGAAATSTGRRRSPALAATAARPSVELSQFKAVWTSMTVHERVGSMSFGRSLRELAVRCFAAVAELNLAARRSADLGFRAGFEGLALVPALEFVPDPAGPPDRPLGMMFGTRLALNPDVPAVLERVLAAGPRRPVLPPAKWAGLLRPPPSSWAGLEAALAALLEQRFLHLLAGIRGWTGRQEAAREVEAPPAASPPARAPRRRRRVAAKGPTPGELPAEVEAPHGCPPLSALAEEPPLEHELEGEEVLLPQDKSSEAGIQEEAEEAAPQEDAQDAASEDEAPEEEEEEEERAVEPPEEEVETLKADGEWQRVAPRRRRRPTAQPPAAAEPAEPPAQPATSSSDAGGGAGGSQFPGSLADRSSLHRAGSQPLIAAVPEEEAGEGEVQPRIEQLLRGWQASVWAAEASSDATSADLWQSRRNENASWRLWFLQRRKKGPAGAAASPREPAEEEQPCLTCADGRSVGRICDCQPDPWQAPARPFASGRTTTGSCPTSPGGSTSGSNVHSGSSGRSGAEQLLAECFAPSLGMEDEDDGRLYTPWRRLLHGVGPVGGFAATGSHAHKAAKRRYENAAWRRWWATHQGEGGEEAEQRLGETYFPPTPTSTYPGTPTGDPLGGHAGFFPGAWPPAPPSVPASQPLLVYLPVPMHLAPQVHHYVQQLLAAESSAVGGVSQGFGPLVPDDLPQASVLPRQ